MGARVRASSVSNGGQKRDSSVSSGAWGSGQLYLQGKLRNVLLEQGSGWKDLEKVQSKVEVTLK